MKDIQNLPDHRQVDIRKVGVREITYPITILDRAKKEQRTIARINMFVNLPHHFKGTHMSRFVEILNRHRDRVDISTFHLILEEMKERLEAEEAHLEMEFPFFVRRGRKNRARVELDRYICRLHGSLAEKEKLSLEIKIPIRLPAPAPLNGLMPRSRGRWGNVTIKVRFSRFAWIEEIINLAEEAILRHNDTLDPDGENSVLTVEGMAGAIGRAFTDFTAIKWFSIKARNLSEGYSTFALLDSCT